MNMKTTVVIGASPVPERFSNKAVKALRNYDHKVIALGLREGMIEDITIQKGYPEINENVDTVSLYIGPAQQVNKYEYILSLKPKRIIFNPGTENEVLKNLAKENNIEVVENCTLIMLNSGVY